MSSLTGKVNSGPMAAVPMYTDEAMPALDVSAPVACVFLATGVATVGLGLGAGVGVASHASYLCG